MSEYIHTPICIRFSERILFPGHKDLSDPAVAVSSSKEPAAHPVRRCGHPVEDGRSPASLHATINYNTNTEEKEDETQAPPSSSPAPRYSSPTLVDSSSPPDMDVQLSVKLDDILNKYPSTRVFRCVISASFPLFPVRAVDLA